MGGHSRKVQTAVNRLVHAERSLKQAKTLATKRRRELDLLLAEGRTTTLELDRFFRAARDKGIG